MGRKMKSSPYETVDDVGLHACKLLPAGRAPRCPEVEQNHLAAQVGEGTWAAVEHFDREVGGRVAPATIIAAGSAGALSGRLPSGQQQDSRGDVRLSAPA